ncbi:DUF2339 domain-containing protein [candidate division KSB1 bacterium]|nr:DUF2339 domain-containing protein [candidate division KSB1 bacterium]
MEILLWLVLLIVLIAYIRKTNQLSEKILKLESEIYGLRNAVHSLQPASTPAAEPRAERAAQPAPAVSPTRATSPPIAARPQPQPSIPLPSAPPSRTREEWEALIGGKLLNRIGAFALILGVGFFLKYAFDNNLISETLRVVIGFITGASLLFGGARFHKKGLAIFAQGLIGAGISIFYLSVYASFNFYHLVSQPTAFVLMALVTALTFFHGMKYDSLAVGVLGWAGGFLTPFLLSTGQANEVGLFTYITLLNIGLLAILLKKDAWVILEPFTLAATYLIYFAWQDKYYIEDKLFVTAFFLTVFWGLFYGLDVFRIIKGTTTFEKIRQAVAGANAFLYFVALNDIVDAQHHNWMSAVTLILGGVYFLTFLFIKQRQPDAILALRRYTLTAIALLVIATEIQFDDFQTGIFWSLEALALVWCGMHWKMRHVWQAALALSGLALLRLIFTNGALACSPLSSFSLLFNQRALAFFVLSATLGASAVLFKRIEEKNSGLIQNVLHGAWSVLLFILFTVESNDYFRRRLFEATGEIVTGLTFSRFMAWAAIWSAFSLPLVWLGFRRNILPIIWSGFGSLGLAIVMIAIQGITFEPIAKFTFLLNWRAAVFVLVIAATVIHTRWLSANRQSYNWAKDALGILQVAIVLLLLDLLTGETRDIFKKAIFYARQNAGDSEASARITQLQNLQQLALSGVWLFYSVALMVAGIWRRMQGLRIIAIALFGITILKIFIYDLSFLERLYRIFSFIGLGVILLAVSYLYQRYKAVIFDSAK